MVEIAKSLKRATNVAGGGFGFFEEMEKHIHKELHENKIGFEQLCTISENVLSNNIGSTKFQEEIEQFLL